ncbi:MAG: hypothetical protein PHZ00_00240 [Candidatus Peribacteraceae bacterium]|nr:hypothetical protein [Candidatus Peribacteraceae bacterium]
MKPYSVFHFSGYNWIPHSKKVVLRYALDNAISFEETLILPDEPLTKHLEERSGMIERTLLALHIIGGISYYKTCLPKTMHMGSGKLTRQEGNFWNSVYQNGLGQFFYENEIDFRGLVNFPVDDKRKPLTAKPPNYQPRIPAQPRVLVPIGGGKDSMVTLELLKKSASNVTLLRMGGSHPIIDELAHASGLPLFNVKRLLSGNLFDLNADGALNGHVPITAYLSILSVLIAQLYDFDAVAISAERSASEGNLVWKGLEINHQWSKGLEFEKAFRRYLKECIGTDIQYFSALRPFSELKIAEIFSQYPQYFDRVTSCNKNWKLKKLPSPGSNAAAGPGGGVGGGGWCGTCPKCAFVFAILSAFISKDRLVKMFGKNLFDNTDLLPLYRELLGIEKFKPFECVGSPEETKAAFLLAEKRGDFNDSPVMKMFQTEIRKTLLDPETLIEKTLKPSAEHCIPEEFKRMIFGE